MTLSNSVYRSFSMATICMGVEAEDNPVKPTISLKNTVTESKLSGRTMSPRLNEAATSTGNIFNNSFSMLALAEASSAVLSFTWQGGLQEL